MSSTSSSPFIDTVRTLAPQIEAAADENEQTRRFSPSLVKAISQAGLFRLWRPRSLGGEEVDAATFVRVVEAVSRIDGAAGWCVCIAGNTSLPCGHLPKEAAREIFGSDPNIVTAGTWPPLGKAVVVDGGYRVTGRWPFASGCHHSASIQGGCRIFDGDRPRLRADGTPVTRVAFFPATSCEILDTWDSVGMRGTGSHDFVVTDLFVPTAHTVSFQELPVEPGPLYALPIIGLSSTAISAVSLGIARHAIDILSEVALGKISSRTQQVISQHAVLQADLGRAEGLLRSGRALLYQTLDEIWEVAAAGETLSIMQRAALFLAATQAAQAAIQTVDLMFSAGGSASLYTSSRMGRCLRDIRTASQHAAVVPANYEMFGQASLGLDVSTNPVLRIDDRSAG
jgi:alkylation response protein AidB-like acyl-CoA dehydrogenase